VLRRPRTFPLCSEPTVVMAGLVVRKSGLPDLRHSCMTDLGRAEVLCIHALLCSQGVDARHKAGHDVDREVYCCSFIMRLAHDPIPGLRHA
jgi:hypothetical protein